MGKKVYICHPFGGKPENVTKIAAICRNVLRAGHIPVSPVHAFAWLDDKEPAEREAGLSGALALLEMCDEIWVFGDWMHSEGCRREINKAAVLNMPMLVNPPLGGDAHAKNG